MGEWDISYVLTRNKIYIKFFSITEYKIKTSQSTSKVYTSHKIWSNVITNGISWYFCKFAIGNWIRMVSFELNTFEWNLLNYEYVLIGRWTFAAELQIHTELKWTILYPCGTYSLAWAKHMAGCDWYERWCHNLRRNCWHLSK